MMRRSESRFLILLLAVMLCMAAFSVSVYADGGDKSDYAILPDGTEQRPWEPPAELAPVEEPEDGDILSALTPEGNLTLIDDLAFSGEDADGNKTSKQFITVQSKNGAYFFIVIDRVGSTENVYFLNMVDEADLFALTEDGEEAEPEPVVCTCKDHCYVGHIDTTCPVCAVNMAECAGRDPVPEPAPSPEPTVPVEPEAPQKTNAAAVGLVLVLILAVAGGAAWYVMKVRGKKAKPQTAGDTDLEDYDYGADGDSKEGEEAEFELAGEDEEYKPYYPDSGGYGPDSEDDSGA